MCGLRLCFKYHEKIKSIIKLIKSNEIVKTLKNGYFPIDSQLENLQVYDICLVWTVFMIEILFVISQLTSMQNEKFWLC